MFGSSFPSALAWLVATKVYSGTGADIVMESSSLIDTVLSVTPTTGRSGVGVNAPNFVNNPPDWGLFSWETRADPRSVSVPVSERAAPTTTRRAAA
jgi:hypothetical protein